MSQGLTAKQEAFCLAIVSGLSSSDAYRKCYNAGKMKAAVVHVKACELLKSGKVAVRLAALRQPAVEEAQLTLSAHLKDLKSLRDRAVMDEKWSAAVAAEVARGKASGLYVEHVKHSGVVNSTITYRANMPVRGSEHNG